MPSSGLRPSADVSDLVANVSNAARPVGDGHILNSRSLPHSGHCCADETAASTAGIQGTADAACQLSAGDERSGAASQSQPRRCGIQGRSNGCRSKYRTGTADPERPPGYPNWASASATFGALVAPLGARKGSLDCACLDASHPRRRIPLAMRRDCTALVAIRLSIAAPTLEPSANDTTVCGCLAGNDRSLSSSRRALRRAAHKSPARPSDAPGPVLACPPSDRPRPRTRARRDAVD